MLTLIQFGPALDLPSASPFCLKAEVLLQLAGEPYGLENWTDTRKAPKGKLPVLRDGDELIPDSTFIRKHLEQKYGTDLDATLNPVERATSEAFVRMAEEHLYWCIVYSRWMDEEHWPAAKQAFFASLPSLLRGPISRMARKQVTGYLRAAGMGRHNKTEVYQLGADSLRAIANFLGDKPYFMGNEPTAADATMFGVLASIIMCSLPTDLRSEARTHQNLVKYCDRLYARFFAREPRLSKPRISNEKAAQPGSAPVAEQPVDLISAS